MRETRCMSYCLLVAVGIAMSGIIGNKIDPLVGLINLIPIVILGFGSIAGEIFKAQRDGARQAIDEFIKSKFN